MAVRTVKSRQYLSPRDKKKVKRIIKREIAKQPKIKAPALAAAITAQTAIEITPATARRYQKQVEAEFSLAHAVVDEAEVETEVETDEPTEQAQPLYQVYDIADGTVQVMVNAVLPARVGHKLVGEVIAAHLGAGPYEELV